MDPRTITKLHDVVGDLANHYAAIVGMGATQYTPVAEALSAFKAHLGEVLSGSKPFDWALADELLSSGLKAAAAADTDATTKSVLNVIVLVLGILGKFAPSPAPSPKPAAS